MGIYACVCACVCVLVCVCVHVCVRACQGIPMCVHVLLCQGNPMCVGHGLCISPSIAVGGCHVPVSMPDCVCMCACMPQGNPMCADHDYRSYVLSHIKDLTYLDYRRVVPADVQQAMEQHQVGVAWNVMTSIVVYCSTL